jgi:hypothetical protein
VRPGWVVQTWPLGWQLTHPGRITGTPTGACRRSPRCEAPERAGEPDTAQVVGEVSDLAASRRHSRPATHGPGRTPGMPSPPASDTGPAASAATQTESHAHPPHHGVSRPITEKPSGTAVNGCAMVISPSEPSARCRAAASVTKPERTCSRVARSSVARSAIRGTRPRRHPA